MSEIVKRNDSRREFVAALNELNDPRTVVLIPDVGFNYLDDPNNNFKVINTGVTEQATVAIAAGMALQGMKPYVYTMINFVAFRPFEMVRNCVALHNADVKLIGVKGSEKYKFLGFSHNMEFEDEDVYHLHKYLQCYLPEEDAVKDLIKETHGDDRPAYIRL